jgi:endonuclease YncB( thermonuclease family)
MKKIYILIIVFGLFSQSSFAKDYSWKVKRVVDGDTLEVEAPFLPSELKLFVRISGIDAPERHGKCEKEKVLAQVAKEFTELAVSKSKKITFSDIAWDKYGGRVLATVKISGKNLGDNLIFAGLAREYHGEKKQGWCD